MSYRKWVRAVGAVAVLLAASLAASETTAQTAFFDEATDVILVDGQTTIGSASTYEAVILFPHASGAFGTVFNEWQHGQEDKLLRIGPVTVLGYNFLIADVLSGAPSMMPDVWHHVAFVYDGAENRMYVDGTLIASAPASGNAGNGSAPAHVGAIFRDNVLQNSFVGYIESIRISDVARYSGSSFAPPFGDLSSDANTQLVFNFNEETGAQTIVDESPLGRTGTPGTGFVGATAPEFGGTPPPADCPLGPADSDLWNVNREILITASSGFQSGNEEEGYNIFGGSLATPEAGTTFFRDQSDGFVHFVEWETPTTVAPRSLHLLAAHDMGLVRRSFSAFRLFGFNESTGGFDLLYTLEPPYPYGGGTDENLLSACANIPELATSRYRAEFVQRGSGTFYGPRVFELDAFTTAVSNVPSGGSFTVTEPDDIDAVSGGDVPLQATLPAGFNATVHEVCYRRTGEAEFACTGLQAIGDGYEGAIPASFVTVRGVQYFFRFSDGTTETTIPATDPESSAFVLPVRIASMRAGGAFSAGTYRMVTIPVDLDDASFAGVLDEYGPADAHRWRLLRWEPTMEEYREYPDLTDGFRPCEAYWLITFDGRDFGIEDGRSVDPVEPCTAIVRPGWNQIGSPFAFPVAWSDVDFTGTLDGPVLYDASAGNSGGDADPYVYDAEILEPWQGYWVFNPGTSDVFMSFFPIETVGTAGKTRDERRLAGDDFELRLSAAMPESGLSDIRNHVGFTPRASGGFDEIDFAEAPPVGDYVRLSILENDMRLAGSFRPAGDGQAWDLRIDGVIDARPALGVVRVTFDEFGLLPADFSLRLLDLDEAQPVRLDAEGFEITLTSSRPVRNLRLIVGTDAFSDEAGDSIPDVPQHSELAQNYPNPFNPSTRIRYQVHGGGPVRIAVFNLLGRRIRTLVDAGREPGWYETVWDGRDDSGTDVPSGVYFYELKTNDGSISRTMTLLR